MAGSNKFFLLNDLLRDEVSKYSTKDINEIKNELNIEVSAKNSNQVIFQRIIANSKNAKKISSLLAECNCIIKTVNLEWNSLLKESMSLKVFRYEEIVRENWENSTLRKYFNDNTFVFVVFKKTYTSSLLEDVKVWIMPQNILESGVKDVWLKTKVLIEEGKIVNYIDKRGRFITNFPTSSETKYIHVRPHAQNKNDTFPLPVIDKVTSKTAFMKHSFWINSNFIRRIVIEGKFYD